MFVEIYGARMADRVEVWVLSDWLEAYLQNKIGTRPLASRTDMENAIGQAIYQARRQFPDSAMSKGTKEGGQARGVGICVDMSSYASRADFGDSTRVIRT